MKTTKIKNEKVTTLAEISKKHNIEISVLSEKFRRCKKNLELNKDYFIVNKSQVEEYFTYNKDYEDIIFLSLSGYMKLTKTINDEMSWKIYDNIIDCFIDNHKSELTIEDAIEFLEQRKLENNPEIQGDAELKDSLSDTGKKILSIVNNQNGLIK